MFRQCPFELRLLILDLAVAIGRFPEIANVAHRKQPGFIASRRSRPKSSLTNRDRGNRDRNPNLGTKQMMKGPLRARAFRESPAGLKLLT